MGSRANSHVVPPWNTPDTLLAPTVRNGAFAPVAARPLSVSEMLAVTVSGPAARAYHVRSVDTEMNGACRSTWSDAPEEGVAALPTRSLASIWNGTVPTAPSAMPRSASGTEKLNWL